MYTTADIARKLGCTVQAVSKYRRKVEAQTGASLGTPDPTDGRRTLFTDGEVEAIAAMAPQIPVTEALDAELIEGDDTVTAAPVTSSLALRHSTLPAVARHSFDLMGARGDVAAITQHSAQVASRGDELLSAFATARMGQALANIDRTVATLEANALGDAVALLGKHTAPTTDGTAA